MIKNLSGRQSAINGPRISRWGLSKKKVALDMREHIRLLAKKKCRSRRRIQQYMVMIKTNVYHASERNSRIIIIRHWSGKALIRNSAHQESHKSRHSCNCGFSKHHHNKTPLECLWRKNGNVCANGIRLLYNWIGE